MPNFREASRVFFNGKVSMKWALAALVIVVVAGALSVQVMHSGIQSSNVERRRDQAVDELTYQSELIAWSSCRDLYTSREELRNAIIFFTGASGFLDEEADRERALSYLDEALPSYDLECGPSPTPPDRLRDQLSEVQELLLERAD